MDGLSTTLAGIPRVTVSNTQPATPNTGDLWLDSGNGNRINEWNGTAWVVVQYGGQAIASGAIAASNVSFTARDIGGVTTTIASTAPASPLTGDLWLDSSNGYEFKQWNGTAWVTAQFGTNAIQAGAITANEIAAGAVVAGKIAAGAVDATSIAAGTVSAGIVNGTTITGAQFVATGTGGEVLVYNGTPAAGNLILAIAASSGSDAYGNSWKSGANLPTVGGQANIYFPSVDTFGNYVTVQQGGTASGPQFNIYSTTNNGTGSAIPVPQVQLSLNHSAATSAVALQATEVDVTGGGSASNKVAISARAQGTGSYWNLVQLALDEPSGAGGTITLQGDGATITQYAVVEVEYGGTVQIGSPFSTSGPNQISVAVDTHNGVRMGSGPQGGYYYEEVGIPVTSVANAASTVLVNLTAKNLLSDYGSAFNLTTGTWTCPVSGPYDFTILHAYAATFTGRALAWAYITTGGQQLVINDATLTGGQNVFASGSVWVTAGTTVNFKAYQASGAGQSLNTNSFISIARRL